VRAIYEAVKDKSDENKINIYHSEEDSLSQWLIIDYFDIILHIFTEEERKFYNIEHLWKEAKKVRLPRKKIIPS